MIHSPQVKEKRGNVNNYHRLLELRKEAKISQRNLAKELGLYTTTYVRYETGQHELPLNIAILLADFYDVSLDYLAGRSNEHK